MRIRNTAVHLYIIFNEKQIESQSENYRVPVPVRLRTVPVR
jgi:hypothetical protein